MLDAFRYIPVLGEFGKGRLRQRTRARFGLRWQRDPVTDEWEIAGFSPALRARYSRRSQQVMDEGGGLAPAARRRVAQRTAGREQPGDTERTFEVLATDAELMAGLEGILAAALSADPGQRPVMPSVAQLVRAMRLPAFAVGRDKGVERREVTAALLAAIPDTLVSLDQAEALTDAVLESAGFTLQSRPKPGSHHTATERYRVPPALVATARTPVGARTSVAAEPVPATTTAHPAPTEPVQSVTVAQPVKDHDQEQQLAQLALFDTGAKAARQPAPARRRLQPQRPPVRHVDLDLASLDPATEAPGDPGTSSPAPAAAMEDRSFGMLLDQDLAALIAEQQDLVDQLDLPLDLELAAAEQALAAAGLGTGPRAQALRLRRARLAEAAALIAAHQLLDRHTTGDRSTARNDALTRAQELAALLGIDLEDVPVQLADLDADPGAESAALAADLDQAATDLERLRRLAQLLGERELREQTDPSERRMQDFLRRFAADRTARRLDVPDAPGTATTPAAPPATGGRRRAGNRQQQQPGAQRGTGVTPR